MRADLHMHSVYSDGGYTPDELCRRARERGVELISITDHDTLNGEREKRAAAKKYSLAYVTGWEISAYEGEYKIHVAGYGCKLDSAYEKFTAERKRTAFERAADSVEKLRSVGIRVTLDDAKAQRADPDSPVHTMHVARAAANVSDLTMGEVYERYLAPGRIAHSTIGRPTPREAIDCIHASGGIASIAHPGRIAMPFAAREKLISDLVDYGADGIEAVYTTHTEEETEYFQKLAGRFGVFVTGGSDTHYEDDRHRIGYPEFYPSLALLERLGL